MAIVIEEGKKKNNMFAIIGWLAILAIIGGAIYYIFFAQPQLVAIPATGSLIVIEPLTELSANPQAIIQGSQFQALHSTITLPTPSGPASVGKNNPFIP